MGAGERGRRGGRSRTRGRRIGGLNRRRGIGTFGRRGGGGGGKIIYSGPGGSAIALAIIFIVLGIFLLVPGCVLLSSGLSNTWSGSGMLVPGIALLSMSGVLLITGITIFIVKKGCGGCNNSVGVSESETTTVVPATESSVPAATTSTTQTSSNGANGQNDERPKHIHINLQYTQLPGQPMPGQPMPGQPMPSPGQFYPVPPGTGHMPPPDAYGSMYPSAQYGVAPQPVFTPQNANDMAYPPPLQPQNPSETNTPGHMTVTGMPSHTITINQPPDNSSTASTAPPPTYDDATRHNSNLV